MMLQFCTLFDKNYLSRGIALYESLLKVNNNFHLYIFAFDDETAEILKLLGWKNATVIPLKEFENEELLSVKGTRTKAEYCWTATPSIILFVLEKYRVDHCTYIDSDLYFYSDPEILFKEMNYSSIMITEHRYTKGYDKSHLSGIYCVQYNTFRNTDEGMTALHWWKDRCIEWCYNREEDGKFGDQRYLDDWTERFKGVHILSNLGGGIAPWNVQQYSFVKKENGLFYSHIDESNLNPVIFYHFHYLRFYEHKTIELGDYSLSNNARLELYYPYIRHLQEIKKRIERLDPTIDIHGNRMFEHGIKQLYIKIKRLIYHRYNRYELKSFLKNIETNE